jgi:hypothetical protein
VEYLRKVFVTVGGLSDDIYKRRIQCRTIVGVCTDKPKLINASHKILANWDHHLAQLADEEKLNFVRHLIDAILTNLEINHDIHVQVATNCDSDYDSGSNVKEIIENIVHVQPTCSEYLSSHNFFYSQLYFDEIRSEENSSDTTPNNENHPQKKRNATKY